MGLYHKKRLKLKRLLEKFSRDNIIKNKVLDFIYKIVKVDALRKDVLYIFVNKLGCKELGKFVAEKLEKMYPKDKQVWEELKTFYYKYDDIRGKNNVICILNIVGGGECLRFYYELFNSLAIESKNTFKVKLFENCVKGIYKFIVIRKKNWKIDGKKGESSSKYGDSQIEEEDTDFALNLNKLKICCKNGRIMNISMYILNEISKDDFYRILMDSFGNVPLNRQEKFLDMIYNCVEKNKEAVVVNLIKNALHLSEEFLCGSIILMKAFNILPDLYLRNILENHFSPVVKYLLENITDLNPFKEEDLKKLEALAREGFEELPKNHITMLN